MHEVSLIDKCTSCQNLISWHSKQLIDFCICGFDLKKIQPASAPPTIINFSKYVSSIIEKSKQNDSLYELCSPLLVLLPNELFQLFTFMCGQVLKQYIDRNASWITVNRINESNEQIQKLLVYVIQIFSDWPISYNEFLENYKTNETYRSSGLAKSFGYFHYALYNKFCGDNYQFLRDGFENFIAKYWTNETTYINKFNAKQKKISCERAAQMLGTTTKRVKKMIETGDLLGTIKKYSSREIVLVNLESVETRINQLKTTLSFSEVVEILGVCRTSVLKIIEIGYISIYSDKTDKIFLFDRYIVNKFLEDFDQQANKKNYTCEAELSSFKKVAKIFSLDTLIKLVLNGKLQPSKIRSGKGLNQYYFSDADVKVLLYEMRQETLIPVKDFAKLIGARHEVAASWIKRGFIIHKVVGGKLKIKLKNQIEFQDSFITLGEIKKVQE